MGKNAIQGIVSFISHNTDLVGIIAFSLTAELIQYIFANVK